MSKTKSKKNKFTILNNTDCFVNSLILIAYAYITILTPKLKAFDSNGPKFLALAILNIVVFFYFVYNKKFRNSLWLFFNNRIGISYSVLMLISLLSFVKAINIHESVLHFSKIITVFIAALLISVVVYNNKKVLLPLAIAMCFLLLFDCLSVFRGIFDIIKGEIRHIEFVKSGYSNKNILASSLFLKIPFALLLIYFYKGNKRLLGIITSILATLAIMFMSNRTFYLAIIFITLALIIFSAIYYKKAFIKKISLLTIIVVSSALIFTVIQNNFYHDKYFQDKSITRQSLVDRILSIVKTDDESINFRVASWKRSIKLIKKEPFLGVGLGNWKIRVLEYENKFSKDYIYAYKNHNDFIEITAETGILGGISFFAIFIFTAWCFITLLLKKPKSNYLKWYFLTFFGIIAYFFDAFFNFPQDRPEIQALFALMIGITIGISNTRNKN